MKIRSLVFCLLFATSLRADLQWKTTTPIYENTLFRFQMPRTPEEHRKETHSYWETEFEGTTYSVFIKPRQCRCKDPKDNIKICDVKPLLRLLPTEKVLSFTKDLRNQWHFMMTATDNFFFFISICYNQTHVVSLVTKTTNRECPEHQQFIESFVFLE